MTRTLTITYEKSNEDIPVMCVAENNLFSITVRKMFTGEKAKQLFKELTEQNVIVKAENEKKCKAKRYTCGECREWGTVNCPETYREPTKNDDACESFKAENEADNRNDD